ncbi:hypothetical protein [uncultured Roseobacter sp.]|uniref:hypothetical protein n=1 Tax=uncultured Roseobacter sp. TaxID=114847 RepID=UPI0026099DE1|nr:hypothetical protein [uncultured Roseobacter sp.]
MRASHLKIMTLAALLCGGLAALASTLLARDDISSQAERIFDGAFASKMTEQIGDPILRVRTGTETFCIQQDTAAGVPASTLISDLSEAFGLDWRQIEVDDLADCPADKTTFYVLQGARPAQGDLLDLVAGIVGSTPPNPDAMFPDWALGLSVSLPGPGHREFVFATSVADMPGDVARSILSEELLQSILRASDVDSREIISLLGEDLRNTDYAQWFHNNPIGFCTVDIVLLELLLGPSTSGLHKMAQMRAHLTSDFDALLAAAETRAPKLGAYADPRCWAWEISS